jgi:cytochrome c biogenesis protein CcmG/thiol:disulfide interchange protein DsbE
MPRVKLIGQVAAVGLVAALFGLLVWKVTHQDDPRGVAAKLERGERPLAPSFTLQRLDEDGKLSLASLRGKVVVLNFWASWCSPCKKEMPRFEAAWQRYRNQGVTFVGVATTDFSGDSKQFLDRYGVTYPNVRDGSGRVLVNYGGLPIPWTYFIGPEGRVESFVHGEVTAEELERGIEGALQT